jgi:hypothetical protein
MKRMTQRKWVFILPLAILLAILFTACSPAVPVTFTTITQQNEGTKVTIAGDLSLPSSTQYSFDNDTWLVELCEPGGTRCINIAIEQVAYGRSSQPNRMLSLGYEYEASDLVVFLNDGTQVGNGAAVIVTGWLGITSDGRAYLNPVTRIESHSTK